MKCPKCNKRISIKPCIYCLRTQKARYQSTLEGKLRHKFRTAKYRAKRDGIGFDLVWDEFREWALTHGFPELWSKWATATGDARKWSTPSLDRIDDSLGYTIKNLHWTTWHWNWSKEQMKNYYNQPSKQGVSDGDHECPEWVT